MTSSRRSRQLRDARSQPDSGPDRDPRGPRLFCCTSSSRRSATGGLTVTAGASRIVWRLTLRVADAVSQTGSPPICRFSFASRATDWADGGWDVDHSVVLARELKNLGIDLIDVSSGGPGSESPRSRGPSVPSSLRAEDPLRGRHHDRRSGTDYRGPTGERDCHRRWTPTWSLSRGSYCESRIGRSRRSRNSVKRRLGRSRTATPSSGGRSSSASASPGRSTDNGSLLHTAGLCWRNCQSMSERGLPAYANAHDNSVNQHRRERNPFPDREIIRTIIPGGSSVCQPRAGSRAAHSRQASPGTCFEPFTACATQFLLPAIGHEQNSWRRCFPLRSPVRSGPPTRRPTPCPPWAGWLALDARQAFQDYGLAGVERGVVQRQQDIVAILDDAVILYQLHLWQDVGKFLHLELAVSKLQEVPKPQTPCKKDGTGQWGRPGAKPR